MTTTVASQLSAYFDKRGVTQVAIAEQLNVSKAYINSLFTGRRPFGKKQAELWEAHFGISKSWLLTGEGKMLIEDNSSEENLEKNDGNVIPLIPASAFAGGINGFAPDAITLSNCERIVSPVNGAQFAIPITGDSMEPDFHNGSIAYIKQINDAAFLPWGHVVILDTENGAFIKSIYPDNDDEEYIWAKSINPAYPTLHIPKTSIFRIFRVLGTSRIFTTM